MAHADSPLPAAKRAIMAESLRLFSMHGVDGVTVRDIAARSGFTNPALFRHFASKEALAQALFTECYGRFAGVLCDDAPADLEAWLRAALEEIVARPDAANFVLEQLRRQFPGLPAELRQQNLPSLVRQRLLREREAGRLRADVDVALAGVVVTGTLGQLARAAHFGPGAIDPAASARALAALLLEGIGRPTPDVAS